MDNYFNNQNNKSKQNEELLDEIMVQQKKRDEKNINKGYLLKNNKKEVSVFKQAEVQADDDKVTNIFVAENYQTTNRGEPMFVIDKKNASKKFKGATANKTTNNYYNNTKTSKKAFNYKKLGIFVLSVLLFLLAFATVAVAIIFTEKHDVKITCGYFDGITIKNEKNEDVNEIKLKLNESFKFKVVVNEGYEINSQVLVTFNEIKLTIDKNGFYTIKNTNNVLNLHIGGIRPNEFGIKLENNNYYLRDRDNNVLNIDNKIFATNDILNFRVVNSVGDNFETNTFCVYYNDVLQTAGKDRFYSIKLNKAGTIKVLPHSPYEFFNIIETKKDDKITYSITALTELGASQEKIYFPDKFLDAELEINVDDKLNYPNVKVVGVPNSATYINQKNFNAFINLEKFEVFSCYKLGTLGVLKNGALVVKLLEKNLGVSKETIFVYAIPQSMPQTKLEFSKTGSSTTLTCFNFTKNCFYNLNTIKEVIINSDEVVLPNNGLSDLENKNQIIFKITSKNYKSLEDGKTILKADKNNNFTILYSVPFWVGKYIVPKGVTKIEACAFANTKITELDFSETTSLELANNAFEKLKELTKIKLPSFINKIPDNCFNDCVKLESVDLTALTTSISISTSAFEGCANGLKIVVKTDLLEDFKTANPNLKNMFEAK